MLTENLLSAPQAAELIFQLTGWRPFRSTIWRWYKAGQLQGVVVGYFVYYPESAVRAYCEQVLSQKKKAALEAAQSEDVTS